MKKSLLLIIILAGIVAGCKGKSQPGKQDKPETLRASQNSLHFEWHEFNKGLELALKQKKPMLVDFYASWCGYCKIMEKTVFNDSEVRERLGKDYISVKVYMDRPYKDKLKFKSYALSPEEFAGAVGIRGLPALAFLDKKGDIITVIPGLVTKNELLPLLGYLTKECYEKKIEYSDYIAGKKVCK